MNIWELALLLFVFIPMALLWFRTIMDIFDRRDLSGVSKVLWLLAVVALPLVGVLVYLFTRPITDQDRERLASVETIRSEKGTTFSVAGEIEKLDFLRSKGLLTDAEFDRQRAALLT